MINNWKERFKEHLEIHKDRIKHFRHYRDYHKLWKTTTRIIYHRSTNMWAWSFEGNQTGDWVMEMCSEKWNDIGYWGRRSLFGRIHEG